ncbi:tetratricopeptide repeat protein [Deltaproteobacteria bacterium IMCC39524]|nr:tetratricopeptide repeat protein [Deltaproteobacteria bacterium IMCC39524]
MKKIALLLVLLMGGLPMAYAEHSDGYVKAEKAFNAGDYQTAIQFWSEEAENGEVSAMEILGSLYAYGKSDIQDYARAAKWLKMAAKKGSANSQYSLGKLYYAGLGVEKSFVHSYAWWLVSSAEGNTGAKKMLKEIKGQLTPEDIELAKQLVFEILQDLSN